MTIRIIGSVPQHARGANPEHYKEQILRELRQERCGLCDGRFPSSVMQWEDGNRRCPGCFEIRGTNELARLQSEASRWIAEDTLTAQDRPIIKPTAETPRGTITAMTTAAGAAVNASSPLRMTRNSAITLILGGQYFTSADTLSYSTGITDNSAPVLSGSTTWTLSLIASSGMTPGDNYSLTFNGTTWRRIFSVR